MTAQADGQQGQRPQSQGNPALPATGVAQQQAQHQQGQPQPGNDQRAKASGEQCLYKRRFPGEGHLFPGDLPGLHKEPQQGAGDKRQQGNLGYPSPGWRHDPGNPGGLHNRLPDHQDEEHAAGSSQHAGISQPTGQRLAGRQGDAAAGLGGRLQRGRIHVAHGEGVDAGGDMAVYR